MPPFLPERFLPEAVVGTKGGSFGVGSNSRSFCRLRPSGSTRPSARPKLDRWKTSIKPINSFSGVLSRITPAGPPFSSGTLLSRYLMVWTSARALKPDHPTAPAIVLLKIGTDCPFVYPIYRERLNKRGTCATAHHFLPASA